MQLIPSPKKCLFWSTMKPIGMKHDKTGITNRMRWLTQLCFYRIREKGMGLLGPRKKRGNMELVEKKSDQSREALSRGPVLPQQVSHSMHVKELQSAFFTHTGTHTHTHARSHARTLLLRLISCFLIAQLYFTSRGKCFIRYWRGGWGGLAQMDPLPDEKCNPTDDEARPRLHMTLGYANWKKKKWLASHLYATVMRNS